MKSILHTVLMIERCLKKRLGYLRKFIEEKSEEPSKHSQLRLPAGAMLYTVSICLLVAMLLSGMILLAGYSKLANDAIYFKELAQDNLESGKNLVLHGKQLDFGKYADRLWDSPIDSYYVETEAWGLFGLLKAEGVHGPARRSEALLFGERPKGAFTSSLYLEDRSRALNISGKTRIQGKIFLPEAGIKRGFVGRTGFSGKSLHSGPRALSKGTKLNMGYARCSEARHTLQKLRDEGVYGAWNLKAGDSIIGNWNEETLNINSNYSIELENISLSGNIVLTAPYVYIGKSAQIQDILIFAHAIHIESGFEGRLQLFATDSIYIERDCKLKYPSAAVLNSNNPLSELYLGEGSTLEGIILADASFCEENKKSEGLVTIDQKAEVIGNVFVAENLDLKGTVTGNLITGKFRLRTESSIYDNHLLDATIRSKGLSKQYAMPLIQSGRQEAIEILQLK